MSALLWSGHSREGAVVAGGHRDRRELVVLEAHDAQLAADAPSHVQGTVERVAIEYPANISFDQGFLRWSQNFMNRCHLGNWLI